MVLLSPAAAVVDGTKRQSHVDYDGEEKSAAASSNSRTKNDQVRIGLAVPEGPFLPLFVLAVHALNVMASTVEDGCSFWKKDDGRNSCSCNSSSVVLIPMDAEDAPDRLRHILTDSAPHMILVAPGRDTDAFIDILADHNDDDSLLSCSMELVDYTALVRDALGLITKGRGLCDNDDGCYRLLLERLYTRHVRDVMMDSVRYGDLAIPNKWDVARLVAWGCGRLNYCLDIVDELAVNDTPEVECHTLTMNENEYHHSGDDKVVSHIVYTSGTTGKTMYIHSLFTSAFDTTNVLNKDILFYIINIYTKRQTKRLCIITAILATLHPGQEQSARYRDERSVDSSSRQCRHVRSVL